MHFYYQSKVEEAFFEGGLSQSAAMSKKLAELAIKNDTEDIRGHILTVSCLSASNFIDQVKNYGVNFPGDYLVKEDAMQAYHIAKQQGIKNCGK